MNNYSTPCKHDGYIAQINLRHRPDNLVIFCRLSSKLIRKQNSVADLCRCVKMEILLNIS